jgi:hypothetical protein
MVVVGDADGVRTAHAVRFFELLGGGKADAGWDGSGMSKARLAVLPATTHYDIFSSPTLASTVAPFLDAPVLAQEVGEVHGAASPAVRARAPGRWPAGTSSGEGAEPLAVPPPSFWVRQNLVGVLYLLEALLGGAVTGVRIGVVLAH